jgi:hypothetical protein
VRHAVAQLPESTLVLQTAVHSYYAALAPHLLLDRLAVCIPDHGVLHRIAPYRKRGAERGGRLWDSRKGIA